MSKGLEALKKIKWKLEDEGILGKEYELCDFIENELKRLEEIDNVMFLNNKKLKALEIIKNKDVDVEYFKIKKDKGSLEDYNVRLYDELTQQEYDLLKEVLL